METTKKDDKTISDGQLELVLREMLEEQKEIIKTNASIVEAINHLSGKVSSFQEKLSNIKVSTPPVDTRELNETLRKGMSELGVKIAMRPGIVLRKFQVLLFPEQDSKLFYKIVFGRWLLWLVVSFLIANIYSFAVHWSDNKKAVELEMLNNSQLNAAWRSLYSLRNKNLHHQMDSVLASIQIPH